MKAKILEVYAAASNYEKAEGMSWYQHDAWTFCLNHGWKLAVHHNQVHLELESRVWAHFVAAAVSVLSPQKEWRVNKALASAAVDSLMTGKPVTGHYGKQCEKVVKLYKYFLLNGADFNEDEVLNIISKKDAKKTRHFYLNIVGDYSVVTVDGHAALLAEHGLTRISITQAKQPSGKAYDAVEAEYIAAAKEIGITPAQLQAIVWVTYRRLDLVVIK